MNNFLSNKTILLPFDFSDVSTAGVEEALEMADKSTRVCMLHVMAPDYVISVEPGVFADLGSNTERTEVVINQMRGQFSNSGHEIEFEVRIGDPGSEIVDYAKEIRADMIVMPSHGRTGLKHLMIGSVAERVLRLATCPVMVLRKHKHE